MNQEPITPKQAAEIKQKINSLNRACKNLSHNTAFKDQIPLWRSEIRTLKQQLEYGTNHS